MYKIYFIEKIVELESIEKKLNVFLMKQKMPQFFFTITWLKTWYKYFSENSKVLIVVVYQGDEIVGFLPAHIVIRKIFFIPCRVLEFIGTKHSPWSAFILKDNSSELYRVLSDALKDKSELWDLAIFQRIREIDNIKLFENKLHDIRFKTRYIEVGQIFGMNKYNSGEDYIKSRKAKLIRNTRRLLKRTKNQGELTILKLENTNSNDLVNVINYINKISLNSWQGKNKSGIFLDEDSLTKKFHMDLIKSNNTDLKINISIMLFDNNPIAYYYGYIMGNNYTGYSIEYDESYNKLGPGTTMQLLTLPKLIDNGVFNLDLGIGTGRHKLEWCDWSVSIYAFYIFNFSLKSRIMSFIYDFRMCFKSCWYYLQHFNKTKITGS
jgi:CelD/BcsL family acetyltransferase involved in cellulose biosynthesis